MRDLTAASITKKNLISTPGAWLLLLTIEYGGSVVGRWVNDQSDAVYDGATYSAAPFTLSPVTEALKGDLPQSTLTLYDANLALRAPMQDNDGLSGGAVTIRRIYSSQAGVITDPGVAHVFTILTAAWDDSANAIVLVLGTSTPLGNRFPRDRYVAIICRHRFRGGFCRYGENGADGIITSALVGFFTVAPHTETSRDYIAFASSAALVRFNAGQTIQVSNSMSNDGIYVIDEVTRVGAFIRFYLTNDYMLTREDVGANVTVTALCDHTIAACRANNNSHMYGGSPGVSEGIYG